MTGRDRFICMASLKESGLSYSELCAFVAFICSKCDDKEKILKSSEKLNTIVRYFKEKEYPLGLIAKIACVSIHNISAEKAIKVDDVIVSSGYSVIEAQRVEAGDTHNIFMNNPEKTGIKLNFYNDIRVKDMIVETSFRLRQPLGVSYARHQFLLSKNCSLEKEKSVLFLSECDFRDIFRVWNDDLVDKYPMDNPKYMIKK